MARKARVKSSTGIYHVMISAVKNDRIFTCELDKKKFLVFLVEYQDVCGYTLYAYSLQDNHIHLLLNEGQSDVSRIMKRIGTSYVVWLNNKYGRQGKLFDDRFKSEVVETPEDFKKVIRHIHYQEVIHAKSKTIGGDMFSSYSGYFENAAISPDLARRIFGGKLEFKDYHKVKGEEDCLELKWHENKLTDEELYDVLKSEYKVAPDMLETLTSDEQQRILLELLREYNLTIRQIARITGINISRIWRALQKNGEKAVSSK